MLTQHSPKGSHDEQEPLEQKLSEAYSKWRKLVMKITKSRIRILRSLAWEGCTRAKELLGEPARPAYAHRCLDCPGCNLLREEGACGQCPGCLTKKGCGEDSRRCFVWEHTTSLFCDGSIVSGVSSGLELTTLDLNNYRALVECLPEISMELDNAIDKFPTHENRTLNPRYGDE